MRIGKQQLFILNIFSEHNNGCGLSVIVGDVRGCPQYRGLFSVGVDKGRLNNFMASVSRSLRVMKKAGLVKHYRFVLADKDTKECVARGYLILKGYEITELGKEVLKVKKRNLTFTTPELEIHNGLDDFTPEQLVAIKGR